MTERTGGSDVGRSETRGRAGRATAGACTARKWFTSAITSQMALTLARPEGNAPGGKGLALFYVELRDADGTLNGIRVNRLKDKLGTRKVPTAELTLDGTRADAGRCGPANGTRAIDADARVTRTVERVCAVAFMRRGLALARDYARRPHRVRRAARRQAAARRHARRRSRRRPGARSCSTFLLVELLGRQEAGEIDGEQRALLRLLTPLAKLVTGKQAVAVRQRSRSRASAAPATSRTPGCRGCCATRRCCRSGKARRTCCRSTR